MSRARRLELQDQTREHVSSVLQALEAVLAGCVAEPPAGGGHGNNGRSGAVGGGASMGEALRVETAGARGGGATEEVVLAALDCLKEWVKLGVSLGGLATDRPLLLDRLVRLLGGEGGPGAGRGGGGAAALQTACAACEVITELVAVKEYPRPPARAAAAEAILGAMGKLPGLFAAAIQVRRDRALLPAARVMQVVHASKTLFAMDQVGVLPLVKARALCLVLIHMALHTRHCFARRMVAL